MVDECPQCAGFWLDAGELHAIRKEYASEAERKAAAEALFDQTFSQVPKTDVEKLQRVAHALKFLSPSFYLSKK